MRKLLRMSAALGLMSVLLAGCESDDDGVMVKEDPNAVPATLVNYETIYEYPFSELQVAIAIAGFDVELSRIEYNVTLHKVTYRTNYKEDSVTASALLFVPNSGEVPVSVLSFQHGTIASDAEAPTNTGVREGLNMLYAAMAGAGVAVVVPDYIGFGSSVEVMHPYYVEDLTATTIINGLYASRQIATMEEANLNGQVYFAGFSQGGYASMAAHKYMEEHDVPFFDLKASFASSGGYDVKGFQEHFFALETYHAPFFMAYVAEAYRVTYDWQQPLSTFFNEPYASSITGLFDRSNSGGVINEALNDTVAVLVQSDLLNNTTSGTYDFLNDAFDKNGLTDWVPMTRLLMFHGDADITVPYQNSVDTYTQLIANGTSEDVLTFTPLTGGKHDVNGFLQYAGEFVTELIKLEDEL